ncbi:MAG TPA: DUF481 domain-containing protein [Bryobacteraceae bacterium]|nr:DUF481 domain-containing protein [Bryobacteraceae bacterium]
MSVIRDMRILKNGVVLSGSLFLGLIGVSLLSGQPKPDADVLLFTDGERLTGHFVKSTGSSLTFKSDALGEITVDWSKVKELQSSAKVAVIPKGTRLRKREDGASVPQGTLSVQDQQVHLAEPPRSIPVADAGLIVDQAGFQEALTHQPGFFHAWKGALTIGAAVVNATQDSESFTGALNLVRAIPTESWLEPRNRTILNLSAAYGEVTQPSTPTIKTSIFHGDAERDQYFSPRLYVFGQGAFDHNFSQGLDLQQTYSGGIGVTVIERPNETLDLKASVSYVRQQFQGSSDQDLDLIGSIFAESFNRKFKRMTLDQHLTLIPTWNNTNAYSGAFNALLTMPVYKRLNASAGFIDSYLNNPPPAFRKNSVQLTIGLTYALP